MKQLAEFIKENAKTNSNYEQLFDKIEELISAKNAQEYNLIFDEIYMMISSIKQTIIFDKVEKTISNLNPKGFYCNATRYIDIKDDPKYHGGVTGAVAIGPGKGKTITICYNNNRGSVIDKADGAFVQIKTYTGGYKKDVFVNEFSQNSVKCLGEDKTVQKFVKDLIKRAHWK